MLHAQQHAMLHAQQHAMLHAQQHAMLTCNPTSSFIKSRDIYVTCMLLLLLWLLLYSLC